MRLGLIINPLSRRNKAGSADALETLAGRELPVARLTDMRELPEALRRLAAARVDLLAVSGGDGTIQAVLTELRNGRPFEADPVLAILAGGTTNMIAGDVGLGGRPEKALAKLLSRVDRLQAGDITARQLIRLDHRPGEPPTYGMFFGTAAIYRAIVFCRNTAEAVGLTSGPASAVTLAGILGRALFARGESEVVRGDDMSVSFDGGPPESGSRLLALATTLDRLVLRARPFWGADEGALRYSEVLYPPKRLLRAVHPFLYGRAAKLPSSDYRSRTADRIELRMTCPFTLDGELYDPLPGVPVRLSGGGGMRFLLP